MVKGIDNAFDHMEVFCPIVRRIISGKIGLFFQEITFIMKFLGSNFLLPTTYTGSKWDFQVANLLLAAVNFEPCFNRLDNTDAGVNNVGDGYSPSCTFMSAG